jgi:hypothetical protein
MYNNKKQKQKQKNIIKYTLFKHNKNMNSNSRLLFMVDKFSQILHFLDEYIDLTNFWMTNSYLWNSNYRKSLFYYDLNQSKSREYLESEDFRAYIISCVSNPREQISLKLSGYKGISDMVSLGNVHALDLSGCYEITDVSYLGNVHRLNLSRCQSITDMSSLGNVHQVAA